MDIAGSIFVFLVLIFIITLSLLNKYSNWEDLMEKWGAFQPYLNWFVEKLDSFQVPYQKKKNRIEILMNGSLIIVKKELNQLVITVKPPFILPFHIIEKKKILFDPEYPYLITHDPQFDAQLIVKTENEQAAMMILNRRFRECLLQLTDLFQVVITDQIYMVSRKLDMRLMVSRLMDLTDLLKPESDEKSGIQAILEGIIQNDEYLEIKLNHLKFLLLKYHEEWKSEPVIKQLDRLKQMNSRVLPLIGFFIKEEYQEFLELIQSRTLQEIQSVLNVILVKKNPEILMNWYYQELKIPLNQRLSIILESLLSNQIDIPEEITDSLMAESNLEISLILLKKLPQPKLSIKWIDSLLKRFDHEEIILAAFDVIQKLNNPEGIQSLLKYTDQKYPFNLRNKAVNVISVLKSRLITETRGSLSITGLEDDGRLSTSEESDRGNISLD